MKKEEIVEALNGFFGLEIRWEKLSKEELQKLYDFLNNPQNLIGRMIDILGYDEFIRTANNTILHKVVDDKPIRKLLKGLFLGGE